MLIDGSWKEIDKCKSSIFTSKSWPLFHSLKNFFPPKEAAYKLCLCFDIFSQSVMQAMLVMEHNVPLVWQAPLQQLQTQPHVRHV